MTDHRPLPSDEEPLPQVGWWCWRGDNHGHLATQACRSDNVPIHVPAEWADEMRAVIQRIEDGDEEEGTPAAPAAAPTATDGAAEPVCVCGHPMRLHHEDVCLTDCGCNDGREPETAADLPARLEAALTARFTELGNPHSGMRYHEQGPDGWPASHPVGPHRVAEVLRELLADEPDGTDLTEDLASADDPTPLRWGLNDVLWSDDDSVIVLLSGPDREPYWLELEPEQAAVLREDLAGPDGVQPADRAALRDRIAETATPFFMNFSGEEAAKVNAGELAAAVLAVLPEPANRGAVLREAADVAEEVAMRLRDQHDIGGATGAYEVMTGLRRLAEESAVTPPPALTEVGRLRAQVEVLQQDAERDRGLAKVGARCMRVGHQGLIEHGRGVIEGWRFALSTALDLDAEASWEAIHERVKELRRLAAETPAADGAERRVYAWAQTIDTTDGGNTIHIPGVHHSGSGDEETAIVVSGADVPMLAAMLGETTAATSEARPVQHAPGKVILCPDCRAKGYSVCVAEPHPTEADLRHALMVLDRFHGRDTDAPAAVPADEYEATTGHLITCFAVAGGNPDPDCPCAAVSAVGQTDEEARPRKAEIACILAVTGQPHGAHEWEPQPGMTTVRCAGSAGAQQDGAQADAEPHCDGFPDTCPNLRATLPEPGGYALAVRCGCYDQEA